MIAIRKVPTSAAPVDLYHRRARCVKVIDGHTIDVDLDLGFRLHWKMRLYLKGINTPELKGESYEAGKQAKDYVVEKIFKHEVVVATDWDKTVKYDRYTATVYYADGNNLNEELVKLGLAKAVDG